jgi:DNA-directed RNA polymerase subunit RPC12/RpoP
MVHVPSPEAADLQAIVDGGQGDRPLKDLKLRCAHCGSRRTDDVMMAKGGVRCAAMAI